MTRPTHNGTKVAWPLIYSGKSGLATGLTTHSRMKVALATDLFRQKWPGDWTFNSQQDKSRLATDLFRQKWPGDWTFNSQRDKSRLATDWFRRWWPGDWHS